jgi:hypothetical protein
VNLITRILTCLVRTQNRESEDGKDRFMQDGILCLPVHEWLQALIPNQFPA